MKLFCVVAIAISLCWHGAAQPTVELDGKECHYFRKRGSAHVAYLVLLRDARYFEIDDGDLGTSIPDRGSWTNAGSCLRLRSEKRAKDLRVDCLSVSGITFGDAGRLTDLEKGLHGFLEAHSADAFGRSDIENIWRRRDGDDSFTYGIDVDYGVASVERRTLESLSFMVKHALNDPNRSTFAFYVLRYGDAAFLYPPPAGPLMVGLDYAKEGGRFLWWEIGKDEFLSAAKEWRDHGTSSEFCSIREKCK